VQDRPGAINHHHAYAGDLGGGVETGPRRRIELASRERRQQRREPVQLVELLLSRGALPGEIEGQTAAGNDQQHQQCERHEQPQEVGTRRHAVSLAAAGVPRPSRR